MIYYPEQLRRIAAMCEALMKVDGRESESEGSGAVLGDRIKVVYPGTMDEEVLGYLVDEDGVGWGFESVEVPSQ